MSMTTTEIWLPLKQDDGQLINSYEYDVWNQLRLVKSGVQQQEVARYDYDYARRRTSKAFGRRRG